LRVLLVHPSPLMYSEIYLRLEPLGMERVAQAVRAAGHEVRLLDLHTFAHADLARELSVFQPRAVGFSLNYLANLPEVVDLARQIKGADRRRFIFVGGHSAAFVADELLEHGAGAIDCVLRGEGENGAVQLLAAVEDGGIDSVPGAVSPQGRGPAPALLDDLD
jgi:hopanoid C-3 methylase